MGILSAIAGAFKALAAAFGWAKQRDAELNSPQAKANAAKQTDAKIADQAAKDEASITSDDFDKNTS
jgi:hypothetical protein